MGNEAGGAGTTNIPIAQPIILAAPTSLPDAPPDRVEKARHEARDEIHNQVIEQFPATRQMLVNPQRLAQLRATLIAKYQLSQSQATQVLRDYVNNPSNMISNRADADVQAAMNGGAAAQPPTQPEGSPQGTGAQTRDGTAAGSRDEFARADVRTGTATPPPAPGTPTPTPRAPTPPPQVVATSVTPPPPPPPPGGMMRGTGTGTGSTLVATGTGTTDGTTGTPESPTPQLPGDGAVLVSTTGTPTPTPGTPRGREGMRGEVRYFLDSADAKGAGASTDTKGEFYTTVAKAQLMMRGGTFQGPPPPQGVVVPRDTFQGILRDGDSALASNDSPGEGGDRTRTDSLGYGRGGAASLLRRGRARDGFGGSGSGFA